MNNYLPILSNESNSLLPIFIIGGSVLLAVVVFLLILFLVIIPSKKKKVSFKGDDWLIALGNKENIKEVSAIGSRVNLVLFDKEKIDREKLKELGVSSVLIMSNKVTLVIEDKAEIIAENIQKIL